MNDEKKYINIVSELNRMTQENALKWEKIKPHKSLIEGTDEKVHSFYMTNYKDKYIGIYPYKYKGSDDGETFYWVDQIDLVICSSEGEPIWRFPHVQGIEDLYESVTYQYANIKEFLDDFFN